MKQLAVIAIGGNSLIKSKDKVSIEDQYEAVKETATHIVDAMEMGYNVVVTHGNGPQVGYILRRSEIAQEVAGMHPVPLANCGADTQGAIGYQIQQAILNEFRMRKMDRSAVTLVTQVKVDKNDPAFKNPLKPIGSFYEFDEMEKIQEEHPDWTFVEDAGRGYRRVVASPKPLEILESGAIVAMIERDYSVIAVGGGGIPVVENELGLYEGVDAVIDKDYATALLANQLNADILIISTGVEKVCLNFGQVNQIDLNHITLSELKEYRAQDHFAPGSMLPKINAVIDFIERGGKKAIITSPEHLREALNGETGTHISK
jgi:carbamate kinase